MIIEAYHFNKKNIKLEKIEVSVDDPKAFFNLPKDEWVRADLVEILWPNEKTEKKELILNRSDIYFSINKAIKNIIRFILDI